MREHYDVTVTFRYTADSAQEAEQRAHLIHEGMTARLTEGMTPDWIVSTPETARRSPAVRVQGQHRGFDPDGHKVVVGWVKEDGSEYLVGLTKCCEATAKGCDGYIGCRRCYEPCPAHLGAEAILATDKEGNPV